MPDEHNTRPAASTIPGVEPGECVPSITHSAPFLTRGTDEQYQARLDEATRRHNEVTGREL